MTHQAPRLSLDAIIIIIIIIIVVVVVVVVVSCHLYSVNCSFSTTSRIVMRSQNLGLTPSIPPDTVLHAPIVFFEHHRSLYHVSVAAQYRCQIFVFLWACTCAPHGSKARHEQGPTCATPPSILSHQTQNYYLRWIMLRWKMLSGAFLFRPNMLLLSNDLFGYRF
jgi:hypothetical protein